MSEINLYKGDCLELMRDIPDGSVDAIICDLPYGTTACKWDVVIPFEPLWAQYRRIIKKNRAIVLFGSEPFSSHLRLSNLKWYKYDWVWNKSHSSGFQYAKYRPLQRHEYILVFGIGRIKYIPQMMAGKLVMKRIGKPETKRDADTVVGGGVKNNLSLVKSDTYYPTTDQFFSCVSRNKSVHPTQKPVALLEYLIKTYTLEGETVLDNTMGSGSTGVACVNLNRNFIGIEKDDKYFEIAKSRINEASLRTKIAV